jgi:predicted ATPase
VGKTRLALKVAFQQLTHFADGVWLVELASLSDPSLVVQHIAEELGIREEKNRTLVKTLVDYLYDKNLLLVFDNCEHLSQEAARLAKTILLGAPQVSILATSREPLGVAGEITRFIPPLSTPSLDDEMRVHDLVQYEAVKLFLDRAVTIKPNFALTDFNAAAVAQICTRLDGIPLAIELAAARLRVLPVEEIADRLDNRFQLLVGNRSAIPQIGAMTCSRKRSVHYCADDPFLQVAGALKQRKKFALTRS